MVKVFRLAGIIAISMILMTLSSQAIAQDQINGVAHTPWPMYQHDPQHTGRSPLFGPVQKPELMWTAQLRDCAGESGGISIAKDNSLLLSIGGCLSNYDPETRTIRWIYELSDNSRSISLVADDDTFFWGFGMDYVQLTSDGSTNWIAELDPNFVFGSSSTFGTDENLYFVHDGVWSFTTSGQYRWFIPYGEVGSSASPAVGMNGDLYAGTNIGNGDICAYTFSGDTSWCLDIPGSAFDRTPSVGLDGTIYLPTDENPEFPADSGVLVAIDPSGSPKWHFQPNESDIWYIPDGIAIGPDSSIYFGLNTYATENYLYSITSDGQFEWQTTFTSNTLTGAGPWIRYPITIDRAGNAYLCAENSRCYGVSAAGNILWDYEFRLEDSIIVSSVTQPTIAQDGLFYLVDNHAKLYAFADSGQYPFLRTAQESIDFSIEQGTANFTTTVPITSTVMPITYTATISPFVEWLSIYQPVGITPSILSVQINPSALTIGLYKTTISIDPSGSLGPIINIPVNLLVEHNFGVSKFYLPIINHLEQPDRIFFISKWFVENQLASIKQDGTVREVISHNLPFQIDDLVYSPDGKKVALVVLENQKHQINILDTETGETLLIIAEPTRVFYPAWSPDSKKIAYISYADDIYFGDVFVINIDGTGLTRLTDDTWNERQMLWSPDGSLIAVHLGTRSIFLMKPDGSEFHQLITGHYKDVIQSWSPDGRYLLLASRLSHDTDPLILGKYDLETGSYTFLANDLIGEAEWSPDGTNIVYVGHDWDIYVIDATGNAQQNLTYQLSNEDSEPAWSPNSQWITFSSRNDDSYDDPNYDIYIVKADGTELRQITRNILADQHPFWKQR